MATPELRGVIPPILTLFDQRGEVEETLQRRYVDWLMAAGVHGLFICSPFGSGPMLSVEQHRKCAEICIDQARKRVPCIVHVASASTDLTTTLARNAEAAGADAIWATPPSRCTYGAPAVVAHFTALVKAVRVPVYAYNDVDATGSTIAPDVALQLAKAGVGGISDTGSIEDFYLMKTRMDRAGISFDFMIGTCGHWLAAAVLGVKAVVSGAANSFPEAVVNMWETTMREGAAAAAELQLKVIRLREIQRIGGTILSAMAVLEMRGIGAGFPKAPLQPLDISVKRRIRDAVVEEGLGSLFRA